MITRPIVLAFSQQELLDLVSLLQNVPSEALHTDEIRERRLDLVIGLQDAAQPGGRL